MKKMRKWVIVGGDSLIGRYLAGFLDSSEGQIILTSRRDFDGKGRIFTDLEGGNFSAVVDANPDLVFLCAGITNMKTCLVNPEQAYNINVTETVNLVSQLINHGVFVIFFSSNTVFDGLNMRPDEHAPYSPVTDYGLQKVYAEKHMLALPGADEHIAIVRLSKVISSETGIVADFLRKLRGGESCLALDDLRMSPVSLNFVSTVLKDIASQKLPGIFHISGDSELSYAEFAREMAMFLYLDLNLIKPVSSQSQSVDVLFRPLHPALGMARTRKILGVAPQSIEHLMQNLFSNPTNSRAGVFLR